MYIMGDPHHLKPIFEVVDKYKIRDSNIIVVGDSMIGFNQIDIDVYNLNIVEEMLTDTRNSLFFVRGNHDNPLFFKKDSGLYLPIFKRLHLVQDYTVLKIEGKRILCVGGAISLDRSLRILEKPYPSWWQEEEFYLDVERIPNKKMSGTDIDMVVTHSAPLFCKPLLFPFPAIVNNWNKKEGSKMGGKLTDSLYKERCDLSLLNEDLVKKGYKIKDWFYGHFHQSHSEIIEGTNYHGMGICEIKVV